MSKKSLAQLFLIFGIFMQTGIFAQVPNLFSYQAVVRNSSNQLLTNQAIGMKISILQNAANGIIVYAETHAPTTDANGLVSIPIGGGTLLNGNFSAINWANGPYFVQSDIDIDGGTNYTITSTSQLLSVPYALYAASSGTSTPGPQGPAGPAGPQGPIGPQGPQGASSSDNQNLYVSETGDTLFLLNGGYVIIPGISAANNGGSGSANTVTDVQGNVYATVQIGTQRWMAENLRTTKFCNGEDIPQISNDNNWNTATTPGWCVYNADPTNDTLFGKLYNWFTVSDPRNACPCGWHVPSDAEFTTLTDFLGTESVAGGKMKAIGTLSGGDGLWSIANFEATNESGFTGLPGGGRASGAQFSGVNVNAWFWNSSSYTATTAWRRIIENLSPGVTRSEVNKKTGCSVRCVQD